MTVAFEEAPVMKAGAQGSNDVQLALVADGCCRARLENQLADISALILSELGKVALADRPQRRIFFPAIERETGDSEPETEYSNLYLAMIANGKLKPFASTNDASDEMGGSEIVSASSNPKSKIENPKPVDDLDPIYAYDLNGNRISMIDPTGLTTYTYDALNRLTKITNNKGQVTSFTYDALGRRTSMTHGNGVVTSYSYDAASQLLNLTHQRSGVTVNSFAYTYDRVGNRKSKADNSGTANYTYDVLNRLTQAVNPLPTNPLESFTYDPVGNRTNSNQNGASVFNQANQLTEDANFTYQYDNNGNLIRKTPKTPGPFNSYEYDAENKLVRTVINGTTVNYHYDGLGRRVEKEVINVATTTTGYVYDNEDILLELDSSNNILARYTHGPGIDEPLLLEKGGASFFYHADGLGSITETSNQSGTVSQRYTYSSFGKIESQLDPNFVQPYTYTSREFDPETGLYFYRARFYDPSVGRFLQEDPIGLDDWGMHRYSFVRNNSINLIDPSGQIAIADDAVIAAVILTSVILASPQVRTQLAQNIKDIIKIIEGLLEHAAEHVNKCLNAPPDDPDQNGWRKEIKAALERAKRLAEKRLPGKLRDQVLNAIQSLQNAL